MINYGSTLANLKSPYLFRCAPYVDIFFFVFFRKKKIAIHLGKY